MKVSIELTCHSVIVEVQYNMNNGCALFRENLTRNTVSWFYPVYCIPNYLLQNSNHRAN